MKPWMKYAGVGVVGLLAGAGIGSSGSKNSGASKVAVDARTVTVTVKDGSTSEPAPPAETTTESVPTVEAAADGSFEKNCDYILGDFTSHTSTGFRFVSQATLQNTGNIGIVVRVKAKWKQAGTLAVVRQKDYRVGIGQSRDVGFTVKVGQNEIDLIQAAAGDDCSVSASIVDTFGDPVAQ